MSMKKVAGGYWSITTTVPVGEKKFRFIVDGVPKHSTRHAIIGANNLFNIVRIEDANQSVDLDEDEKALVRSSQSSNNPSCSACCRIS